MSRIKNIKTVVENNIDKKSYKELCYEENTKSSMINSLKESYNYDKVCSDIKTSDTLIINDEKIVFVEFKDVNLSKKNDDRKFLRELRLKVIESYVTFYNFLNENSLSISKDELSELSLNYEFVFNKEAFADKPTLLNAFSAKQLKWTNHYKRFYNKISFIDHETFINKYKID